MSKVAIIVDSLACLKPEMIEQYGITVMPLTFYFGGRVYRDWVDITPSEAYELFLKDPDSFQTSAVSPGAFIEVYRQVSQHTDSIFCITASVKLTACYSAALDAREQVKTELPGTTIEVMDSRTVTAAEGFVCLASARAAAEGKSLAEVVKIAGEMSNRVNFFVFLNTIRHVYRSGRIPKIASQAGSILNIKPILTMSSGALQFNGVARSSKSGVERLLRTMRDRAGPNPVHVSVMHAYAAEEAEALREKIASEFDCAELWIGEFSPIMGYACGTGTLGIAFYCGD